VKRTTRRTLIAVMIVPCLALGMFLGTLTNKTNPKKSEKKKTAELKKGNPLSAYTYTRLSDPEEEAFKKAGKLLLTETIQSDSASQKYEELLKKDPINAYSSILWAYRNSKGIAEKANTLSKFPSDDGYYSDNDVLAEKNTLVSSIADDMSKGKYKSAYMDANTLNDLLTSFVNRKTAEEKAKKEEEERQRQLANGTVLLEPFLGMDRRSIPSIEAQKAAEEAEKAKADEEKKNNANAIVQSVYQTIPQSARQVFESAGGSIQVVTTDAMPSTGATVCSDLTSRTIYVDQDTVASDSHIQTEIVTEFAKQIDDLKQYSKESDWQNTMAESDKISGMDSTMTDGVDRRSTPRNECEVFVPTETTDSAQWFEEAFTEYVLHPDTFPQACPNTAKLLKQLFSD